MAAAQRKKWKSNQWVQWCNVDYYTRLSIYFLTVHLRFNKFTCVFGDQMKLFKMATRSECALSVSVSTYTHTHTTPHHTTPHHTHSHIHTYKSQFCYTGMNASKRSECRGFLKFTHRNADQLFSTWRPSHNGCHFVDNITKCIFSKKHSLKTQKCLFNHLPALLEQ